MSHWWSAAKYFLKTVISRRLTLFCKLVIVSFIMGFNKNLKVRVPKCRFDERHQKTRWMRRLRGVWQYFANIGLRFGPNGVQEIFTVRAPNWRSDDKQEKQAKKDYYEASDSLLQTGHLLSSNRVQQEFHRTSSKIWLLWKAPKNKVKTKFQRRVKISCKLRIF